MHNLTNGGADSEMRRQEVIERRALDWQKAVQIIDKISGCTLMYDATQTGRVKG